MKKRPGLFYKNVLMCLRIRLKMSRKKTLVIKIKLEINYNFGKVDKCLLSWRAVVLDIYNS